jgi:hypothetical protein
VSTTLFQDEATGLTVRSYCGPERSDGGNRRRISINTLGTVDTLSGIGTGRISLSAEEYEALALFFHDGAP